MSGFEVVIDALHTNVKFLQGAEDSWEEAHKQVRGKRLGPDDLGLLGKQNGVPESYNRAAENLTDGLSKGVENLRKAADSLRAVADDQARREEEIIAKLQNTQ